MRPFVIVELDEGGDGSRAVLERPATLKRETFVIDRPKEALDLAVRLRATGAPQVVDDAQTATRLLKPGEPLGVLGVPHRKREGIVRQHRLDTVWECGHDGLQERRGGGATLVRRHGHHGLAAEIVDRGKFIVVPGISQRRQEFDIQMQQLAGPTLLIPFRRPAAGPREPRFAVSQQHTMDRLRTDRDERRDPRRSEPRRRRRRI